MKAANPDPFQILESVRANLLAMVPHSTGVSIGKDKNNQGFLVVFVKQQLTPEEAQHVPAEYQGYPLQTRLEDTGLQIEL